MDKLDHYRQIIQTLLAKYAETPVINDEIESQLIFDTQRDHYQVMDVGWDGHRRVHGCVIHLDIKENKIWLQHNARELRIAHKLVEMGVAREDIILGFQAPYVREYTEFGVA